MLKIFAVFSIVRIVLPIMSARAPLPTIDEWKTWPLEELEKQMSPSRWNPHKTPEQVIDEYVNVTSAGTLEAQKNISHKLNVTYGSLPSQAFDVYGTELGSDAPIFIWIHGGYWQEGGKDAAGFFANAVHSLGFRFIALGYTLAPKATLDQMQNEVTSALKTVTSMYPNSKVVVGGHSAGAHLAASLLTGDAVKSLPGLASRLVGLYLVSGVYDLRPLVGTYVNKPLSLTPETAEAFSPLFQNVQEGWLAVPLRILIIMGEHDSPEFQRQSTGYYELIKSQFPTEFWVSEDDDHFSIVEKLMTPASQPSKNLQEFLTQFHNVRGSLGSRNGPSGYTMGLLAVLLVVGTCVALTGLL